MLTGGTRTCCPYIQGQDSANVTKQKKKWLTGRGTRTGCLPRTTFSTAFLSFSLMAHLITQNHFSFCEFCLLDVDEPVHFFKKKITQQRGTQCLQKLHVPLPSAWSVGSWIWSYLRPSDQKLRRWWSWIPIRRCVGHRRMAEEAFYCCACCPHLQQNFLKLKKKCFNFLHPTRKFHNLKVFHWIELYIFHSLSLMVHAWERSERTFSSLTSKFSRTIV